MKKGLIMICMLGFVSFMGAETTAATKKTKTTATEKKTELTTKPKSFTDADYPQQMAFTIQGGLYRPNKYIGHFDKFKNVYTGDEWIFGKRGAWWDMALEWQFLRDMGKLGLKATTGTWLIRSLHVPSTTPQAESKAYWLWMFPLFGGLVYHFQYSPKQPLIPYVEGAYGLTRFQQMQGPRVHRYTVNRTALIFGGGLQFNLRWLNSEDTNLGTKTHIIASMRHVESIEKGDFDFSGNVLLAGLMFEF